MTIKCKTVNKRVIGDIPEGTYNILKYITVYHYTPATLHTAKKRARPPSDILCETSAKKTPYVIDLRSPERMTCPSATAEQIATWSLPESPSAYLSPSCIPTTSAFSPPDAIPITSSSASCSQPPYSSHQTAALNSVCTVPVGTIAAMSQAPKRLMWDSGANRSGTGRTAGLHNVTVCPPLSIQGAFGPPIQPTYRGQLGPMNLETVVIDGMGPSTIVSVSQVCKLEHIAVFTNTEFVWCVVCCVLHSVVYNTINIRRSNNTQEK
jgi:hypothetical protein